MSRTLRKALIGTAALLPAAALGVAGSATSRPAATPAFPAHYSAPYLQIASSDAGDMAADMAASGDKFYTLAFLTPKSGCTAEWEDGGDSVGAFTSQISSLQVRRRRRHHLLRRRRRRRTGPDLHLRLQPGSRLRQGRQHLPRHPPRLRHRRLRAGRHHLQLPPRPGPGTTPGRDRRPDRLHHPRRPHRHRVQRQSPAQRRQEQGRQGQPRQHHDHGLRRRPERPQRRRVRRQGHRRTTGRASTASPPPPPGTPSA